MTPEANILTLAELKQLTIIGKRLNFLRKSSYLLQNQINLQSKAHQIDSFSFTFSLSRPDIAALRDRGALPATQLNPVPPPIAAFTGPNLEDLEAPRRQTSMDGEAIKIVIHDVDSGPICASKRKVILRRDPTDKAHRSE